MTGGELAMACLLDAAAGDPRWFPHPVRWMGSLVNWCDRRIHQLLLSPAQQRIAGLLLAVALPSGAYAVGVLLIWLGNSIDSLWGSVVVVLMAWTTLAARDLIDHVLAVQRALQFASGHRKSTTGTITIKKISATSFVAPSKSPVTPPNMR